MHIIARGYSYPHAARHMLECQALDPSITDYAAFKTHDAFVDRIRLRPVVSGLLYALLVLALFIYRFVVQAIWDVQTVFF